MILDTSQAKMRHLLRRTGFTATSQQVEKLQGLTIPQVVDDLLNAPATHPMPPQNLDKTDIKQLPLWWLHEMVHTSNPFLEKMTFFWHGHFTSSIRKVKSPNEMGQQNQLLRQHALGNFRELTYEISIDPAMLIWLDNNTNVKQSPNENYARELMELFTLGIGNYTEQDVHEVARALTGWKATPRKTQAQFVTRLHDDGTKTIFGKRSNFDLKSTVDLIVQQPACARFITTKLWSAFAYPNPEPTVIQPVIDAFVKSGFEIKALLRAMFTSEAFYSDKAYRSIVKSPTEYVVGILALFPNLKLKNEFLPLQALNEMGQMLFDPPNVAGWPGGAAWLSSNMLFARFQFAEMVVTSLTTSDFPPPKNGKAAEVLQTCMERVGLPDLSSQTRQQIETYIQQTSNGAGLLRGILHLLFVSPEAQLN